MKLNVPWNFTRDSGVLWNFTYGNSQWNLTYHGTSRVIRGVQCNFTHGNSQWNLTYHGISRVIRGVPWNFTRDTCIVGFRLGESTIMDKSLGTNLHLWRFFTRAKQIHLHLFSRPPPPPTMLDTCTRYFSRVSTLYWGVGGGSNAF